MPRSIKLDDEFLDLQDLEEKNTTKHDKRPPPNRQLLPTTVDRYPTAAARPPKGITEDGKEKTAQSLHPD